MGGNHEGYLWCWKCSVSLLYQGQCPDCDIIVLQATQVARWSHKTYYNKLRNEWEMSKCREANLYNSLHKVPVKGKDNK